MISYTGTDVGPVCQPTARGSFLINEHRIKAQQRKATPYDKELHILIMASIIGR